MRDFNKNNIPLYSCSKGSHTSYDPELSSCADSGCAGPKGDIGDVGPAGPQGPIIYAKLYL